VDELVSIKQDPQKKPPGKQKKTTTNNTNITKGQLLRALDSSSCFEFAISSMITLSHEFICMGSVHFFSKFGQQYIIHFYFKLHVLFFEDVCYKCALISFTCWHLGFSSILYKTVFRQSSQIYIFSVALLDLPFLHQVLLF